MRILLTALLLLSRWEAPPCLDDFGNPCAPKPSKPKPTKKEIPDTDNDGISDPSDSCVSEPETRNSYQDGDGCPDKVPEHLSPFVGRIKGITFDTDRDTIRSSSRPTLDTVVEWLKGNDINIEIEGHTDDVGNLADNLDLARRRAESVKKYLVDSGIDSDRIATVGFGPYEPVDVVYESDSSSLKKKKRANNRRIEFNLF